MLALAYACGQHQFLEALATAVGTDWPIMSARNASITAITRLARPSSSCATNRKGSLQRCPKCAHSYGLNASLLKASPIAIA
jgi:hypothetical protein